MSEAVKWDGFPKEFRRNTGTHYLLKLDGGEEILAGYCPYDEEWSGPGFMLGRKNTAKHYSYLRPFTVVLSVEEMEEKEILKKKAIAEAVAAEREQWSATVANALNWLKHGRIANARDDLKAAQRRAVNEAIRSAAK